jgi:hypothetical protein
MNCKCVVIGGEVVIYCPEHAYLGKQFSHVDRLRQLAKDVQDFSYHHGGIVGHDNAKSNGIKPDPHAPITGRLIYKVDPNVKPDPLSNGDFDIKIAE